MTTIPNKAHSIFISHNSKDNNFTRKLAEDLRHILGDETAVWYDYRLTGGNSWWRKIVEELTKRNIFIVVLSPDAMRSKWVHDEIDFAWQQKNSKTGKIIIPLIYRSYRKKRQDIDTDIQS